MCVAVWRGCSWCLNIKLHLSSWVRLNCNITQAWYSDRIFGLEGLLKPSILVLIKFVVCFVFRGTFSWCFEPTKLALMSFFSFWMTLFPPYLPSSLPFGHIAYKSQDILVSGLQKAWPPGKACRTAVIFLIQTLNTLCLCLCLRIMLLFHPLLMFSFSRSYTAPEQVCFRVLLPSSLAVACWHAFKSSCTFVYLI